jgi:hypothetical protein
VGLFRVNLGVLVWLVSGFVCGHGVSGVCGSVKGFFNGYG